MFSILIVLMIFTCVFICQSLSAHFKSTDVAFTSASIKLFLNIWLLYLHLPNFQIAMIFKLPGLKNIRLCFFGIWETRRPVFLLYIFVSLYHWNSFISYYNLCWKIWIRLLHNKIEILLQLIKTYYIKYWDIWMKGDFIFTCNLVVLRKVGNSKQSNWTNLIFYFNNDFLNIPKRHSMTLFQTSISVLVNFFSRKFNL